MTLIIEVEGISGMRVHTLKAVDGRPERENDDKGSWLVLGPILSACSDYASFVNA